MASKPSRGAAALVAATLSGDTPAAGSPHDPPPRMSRAPISFKPTPSPAPRSPAEGEAGPAPSLAPVQAPAPVAQEPAPPAAAAPASAPVGQEPAPPAAAAPVSAPVGQEATAPAAAAPASAPGMQDGAPPSMPSTAGVQPDNGAAAGKVAGEAVAPAHAETRAAVGKKRLGRPSAATRSEKGPDDMVPVQVFVPNIARERLNIIRIQRHYPSLAALLIERVDDILEEEGLSRLCGTTRKG